MKEFISKIPYVGIVAKRIRRVLSKRGESPESFPGSAEFWEHRYAVGGNSGVGSYAQFAEFKADVINAFVAEHSVQTVLEFGCGDGNQLGLARYRAYTGFDVSSAAISRCRERFKLDASKTFHLMDAYAGQSADLVLSLDVIFHLVEDPIYERYMRTLFDAATRFVIIYSSDTNDNESLQGGPHVRHRKFTEWTQRNLTGWKLVEHLPNRYPYGGDYRTGSFSEFFIYRKGLAN